MLVSHAVLVQSSGSDWKQLSIKAKTHHVRFGIISVRKFGWMMYTAIATH